MNGFKVFKLYTAIKLHFTDAKFDVFKNRGNVRGTYDTFAQRNDKMLFEKLAKQSLNERELIKFIAANFMYGNPNFIYSDDGEKYYVEYNRRRQSITRVFEDDLDTAQKLDPTHLIQLYLGNKITLETMVILDEFEHTNEKLRSSNHLNLMFGSELLVIEKSKKFIHYDLQRVQKVYHEFAQDSAQLNNCTTFCVA